MNLKIKKAESLPPLARGGNRKPSAETVEIQQALKTFEPQVIEDVPSGNTFNSLSQKIRTAAKNAGISVAIRTEKTGKLTQVDGKEVELINLYFKGETMSDKVDQQIEREAEGSTKTTRSRPASK